MAEVKFMDILKNPHFNQFASIISVPFGSLGWKHKHPSVPFWTLWEDCTKLLKNEYFADESGRKEVCMRFLAFICALVEADAALSYDTEDMNWFVAVMDGPLAHTTMSMLFAVASSKDSYVTPAQVAEVTQTGESTWRKRAAEGEIMGAYKAGKQWLLPVMALRARSIDIETKHAVHAEDVEQEEE